MWLPRDERKLLRFYYEKIGEPEKENFIDENDLVKTIFRNVTRIMDKTQVMTRDGLKEKAEWQLQTKPFRKESL